MMYVEFLTQETAKKIREMTVSFDAYTLLHPMRYGDYRSYLREVLALIRKNIKAYVNGEAVETFYAQIIVDSETVSKMQDRAEYFIRVKLFKPVEYLGEIAAALAHELGEKQEETK
mgnify:CR=1 FL=1